MIDLHYMAVIKGNLGLFEEAMKIFKENIGNNIKKLKIDKKIQIKKVLIKKLVNHLSNNLEDPS